MPVLRELGVRGAVFDYAFAPSNVTRRSIPSMMIGLAPNRVQGPRRRLGAARRSAPRHARGAARARPATTPPASCAARGSGARSSTPVCSAVSSTSRSRPNGLALARRARAWLDERAKHPTGSRCFCGCTSSSRTTGPRRRRVAQRGRAQARCYDRSLAAADAVLGELLGAFAQRPPDQAPIVIVTADHGEALGEHGQPYHSTDLYDSQIQVPLVIAGPGIRTGRIAGDRLAHGSRAHGPRSRRLRPAAGAVDRWHVVRGSRDRQAHPEPGGRHRVLRDDQGPQQPGRHHRR